MQLNFKERPVSYHCFGVVKLLWEDIETLKDEVSRLQALVDEYEWTLGIGEEDNGRRR